MITLFEEAARLQGMLLDEGLDFFFVGGIPLQIWGQPRLTTDIDLTVFTELINEDERIKWFLSRFNPLIGTQDSTLQFARQRRVLLLQTESKTEIDVMLGGIADISAIVLSTIHAHTFAEDLFSRHAHCTKNHRRPGSRFCRY